MKKKQSKAKQKRDRAKQKRVSWQPYLEKAGYTLTDKDLFRGLIVVSLLILLCNIVVRQVFFIDPQVSLLYRGVEFLIVFALGLPASMLLTTLFFYIYTDMRITNRKRAIEKVLPEFLQLSAANIRAGMPIDQALWSSVRPQFGVLSAEISLVAKQTMVGEDLSKALLDFAKKYDSKVLSRAMNLLVEGVEAGSEIGDLLENLSLSIQDIQIRRESMAANVTTYVIFIAFSVLVAAPLLFGVSMQMLRVVHVLGGKLDGGAGASSTGISVGLSTSAVSQSHFFVFCIVMLLISSVMSSVIIAAIKTGQISDAVKSIPVFATCSVVLFIIAQWVLGFAFAGLL